MKVSIRLPDDVPESTPMAVSLRSTRELPTGNWRTFRPVYVTRPSPCNLDCPAGTDVRGFLTQAAAGDATGAWRTILRHNPLPGVCGRVCYHPCEAACNRSALDERVAVHAVERAVAAEALRSSVVAEVVAGRAAPSGARVAVVGSGPAGLSCAYHLALAGHEVTIFDSADEPGGMLRYGIPEYRLPRQVLDQEIGLLRELGVQFRMRARLGSGLPWSSLQDFAATFLAVGTQHSKAIGVEGERLLGVSPALTFLREINGGSPTRVSGRVVVIGGGNTAIDAARVALRHGAHVTVLYRRTREEMPAHPDEIAQAEAEGVRFECQAVPVRFQGRKGTLHGVQWQRTRPGQPDASGRRQPEPVPGDLHIMPCEHVFTAIGEELEEEPFESIVEIVRGRLSADRWGHTSSAPVFAGGDAATGAGTVVEAIGSGRRAAEAIGAWMSGAPVELDPALGDRVLSSDLNLFYFGRAPRVKVPTLNRAFATTTFREVSGGLFWTEAVAEAGRCLSCGSCNECGNCLVFCPDAAVHKAATGYTIDYMHCKGCGICVAECPRSAMELVPEEAR